MNKKKFIILGVLILILLTVLVYLRLNQPTKGPEQSRGMDNTLNTNEVVNNQKDEIDTSDWKTYRNEEYGFEVKYPEEWITVKRNLNQWNIIGFREKKLQPGDVNFSRIYIDIKDNSSDLTLSEYYKNLSKTSDMEIPDYYEINDVKYLIVDGMEAVQFLIIPGSISNTKTSILYDKGIIEVDKHNDDSAIDDIYNRMLKTFEFID